MEQEIKILLQERTNNLNDVQLNHLIQRCVICSKMYNLSYKDIVTNILRYQKYYLTH